MKLLRINMHAFGKFQEYEISFQDGINLIYGENEAGKSTIHRFIRGMLFGFKQEGRRRRYYTPEWEHFRPWNGSDYRGSLEFERDDGVRVLIERHFERDETRILDALTGKSLADGYEMDSRREYKFAQDHLGLNATIFDNTIFLAQLGGKTGKELAREVAGRLASLSTSGREDLSVRQALEELHRRRDEIGSSRAPTRPLGKAVRICEDLEKERDAMTVLYQSLRDRQEEKAAVDRLHLELVMEQEALREELERAYLLRTRADGQAALQLWQLREVARTRLEELKDFAGFPDHLEEEIRENLTRLDSLITFMERLQTQDSQAAEQANELQKQAERFPASLEYNEEARRRMVRRWDSLQVSRERLAGLVLHFQGETETKNRLEQDLDQRESIAYLYEVMDHLEEEDDEIQQLQYSSLPAELSRAEDELAVRQQSTKQSFARVCLTALAAFIGGAVLIGQNQSIPAGALAALGSIILILGIQSRQQRTGEWRKKKAGFEEIAYQLEQEQLRLEELVVRKDEILSGAGVDNLREARRLADRFGQDREQLEQIVKALAKRAEEIRQAKRALAAEEEKLTDEISRVMTIPAGETVNEQWMENYLGLLKEHHDVRNLLHNIGERRTDYTFDLESYREQHTLLEDRCIEIMDAGKAADWNEFQAGCRAKESYRDAKRSMEDTDQRLSPYLQQRSIPEWHTFVQDHPPEDRDENRLPADLDILKLKMEEVSSRLHGAEIRAAALGADMDRALEGKRELSDILEEYAGACREKKHWENEAAILDIALEALAAAAEKRHRLLAPELNHRVGNIIAHLTDGRYQKVRIDEDLAVTVSTPDSGRQVDLSSLSAGTVDQFYFSVRIAMADLISQDRSLPLFLDDPFVQYSSRRLHQVLFYLGGMAAERQILLFTCRDREKVILDELDVPYHEIHLK